MRFFQFSIAPSICRFGLVLACAGWPTSASAQSAEPPAADRSTIVSLSPIELFYKAQLVYEHRLGQRNSLGAQGTYRYGFGGRYSGWQATGFYRRFLTRKYPTGLYFEAQASVFNFLQEANLYEDKTRKYYLLKYRGVSGGGGFGLGYRSYLFRQATGGRLLWNAMLGGRAQIRPQASYDTNVYSPAISFIGDSGAFSWYATPSPGSIVHGLLTLDYQF